VDVPGPVRRLAVHPFLELPARPQNRRIAVAGVQVQITPWPSAQIVDVLDPDLDVGAAVEAARAVAREHDKTTLGWWIAPEHDHVTPELEGHGLVNEDTPGFEAVENAMALVQPPAGSRSSDVEVTEIETLDDYIAASRLADQVFGMTALSRDVLEVRFRQMQESPSARSFVARLDGRPVGSAFAALGEAGVNLFGGGVHPDARGRGVYRALVEARWELAVARGTPALTVQASAMARPICERFGFVFVAPVRVFVDALAIS
jgi:GNAT superfamily N-acetyltransferase